MSLGVSVLIRSIYYRVQLQSFDMSKMEEGGGGGGGAPEPPAQLSPSDYRSEFSCGQIFKQTDRRQLLFKINKSHQTDTPRYTPFTKDTTTNSKAIHVLHPLYTPTYT